MKSETGAEKYLLPLAAWLFISHNCHESLIQTKDHVPFLDTFAPAVMLTSQFSISIYSCPYSLSQIHVFFLDSSPTC